MSDLHRRRSSGLYLLFVFPIVVCVHTTFAATLNPSPAATDVAAPPPTAALSPEIRRRSAHGSSQLRGCD